jgi:uncharacterized protein YggT (Ycf19 family)
MRLFDLILDLLCLLLWVSWRMASHSPGEVPWHRTLLRTLRRASPKTRVHWGYPVLLIGILILRGLLYQQIGSAMSWVPHLDFGPVAIPFRSDRIDRMMLFSGLSFGQWLGGFYLWLLMLSALSQSVPEGNAFRHFGQVNLGWPDEWPTLLKLTLPVPAVAVLWFGLIWCFARLGLMPVPASVWQAAQQGIVLGLTSVLLWKYLLVGILFLHLLHCYIYLGKSPFWEFVEGLGRSLLSPLQRIPLRVRSVDFAPLVVLALVFLIAEITGHWLEMLYRRLPL